MKKLESLIILLICALMCFGCAQNEASYEERTPSVSILSLGDASLEDLKKISEKISEKTMEVFGCRVELKMIRQEEYDSRIDNLLLERELADIFICRDRTALNKLMDGNYIYRLDRHLEVYKSFKEMVPEDKWKCVERDGYAYGIPLDIPEGGTWGFVMNSHLAHELGADASKITGLTELYEVLLKVKERYPDMIPVVSDHGQMNTFAEEKLLIAGGGNLAVGKEVLTVTEMDDFIERCRLMEQWNKEGLIMDNAAFTSESIAEWIDSGLAFGGFSWIDEYSYKRIMNEAKTDIQVVPLNDIFYGMGASWMSFAVYARTEDVDLSLKVLEYIYSEPWLLSLCIYGTEETAEYPFEMKQGTEVFDNFGFSNEIYQCGERIKKYYESLCAGQIPAEEGTKLFANELKEANTDTLKIFFEQYLRSDFR